MMEIEMNRNKQTAGTARPIEYPFLRDNEAAKGFYQAFMIGIALGTSYYVWIRHLIRHVEDSYTSDETEKFFSALFMLLIAALHAGAPFLAAVIVEAIDFGTACQDFQHAFIVHSGGDIYKIDQPDQYLGKSSLQVSGDTLTVRFIGEPNNWAQLGAVYIPLSATLESFGSGSGFVNVFCDPEADKFNSTNSTEACISGTADVRLGSDLVITTTLAGNPPSITSIRSSFSDWYRDHFSMVTIDGKTVLKTAIKSIDTSGETKMCTDSYEIAIIGSLIVPHLQKHLKGCVDCIEDCTNDHSESECREKTCSSQCRGFAK